VILVDKTRDDDPKLVRSSSDRPRRTTSRRRFIQKLERGLTGIGERTLDAARSGLGTYVEARDRSAANKTDGAYKDFGKNIQFSCTYCCAAAFFISIKMVRILNSRRAQSLRRRCDRKCLIVHVLTSVIRGRATPSYTFILSFLPFLSKIEKNIRFGAIYNIH